MSHTTADNILRATLEVGPLGTCCYILAAPDSDTAIVIDPGADAQYIQQTLDNQSLTLELILLTHSHYDHIAAAEELLQTTPTATLACHAICNERAQDPELNLSMYLGFSKIAPPATRLLDDNEEVSAAGLTLRTRLVPGHAPGHLVYLCDDAGSVFCGDVVFAGGIGRSDFPGGNGRLLVEGIHALLKDLPEETTLYPGHGPSTTAGREIRSNPFL